MKNKKAQTASEFTILVAFVLFFFVIFFLVIQEKTGEKVQERQNFLLKETAFNILDEINLALKASEGYFRVFNVPEKIGSRDYEIQIIEDMIYLRTTDEKNSIALPIPEVQGNIVKGENNIKKQNGEILINQ
jgi:uncharacterized ion transporter superfamily protein YfcC